MGRAAGLEVALTRRVHPSSVLLLLLLLLLLAASPQRHHAIDGLFVEQHLRGYVPVRRRLAAVDEVASEEQIGRDEDD